MMKKLLIIVALFFTYQIANAQISAKKAESSDKVGSADMMGSAVMEKSGDLYLITYRDAQYSKIQEYKSFSFRDVDNAVENLYQIIMDGLEDQPDEAIIIELPDDKLYLNFKKQLGAPYVEWTHKNGGNTGYSVPLGTKKIEKLFDKR